MHYEIKIGFPQETIENKNCVWYSLFCYNNKALEHGILMILASHVGSWTFRLACKASKNKRSFQSEHQLCVLNRQCMFMGFGERIWTMAWRKGKKNSVWCFQNLPKPCLLIYSPPALCKGLFECMLNLNKAARSACVEIAMKREACLINHYLFKVRGTGKSSPAGHRTSLHNFACWYVQCV